MEVCLGKLSYFCIFHTGCNWDLIMDVLQSKCPDCMGECLFFTIPGVGRMVFKRSSSLHGTGYDCAPCSPSHAGGY